MDLNGAVVLVTGGRGGLGQRVGEAFQRAGAHIVAADVIPTDAGRRIENSGASQVLHIQADTATSSGAQAVIHAAEREFGRVDVLVNNAGINRWVEFTDLAGMSDDLWDEILAVDLKGPWLCSKAVAPIMQRQQSGRIVSVASIAGIRPSGSSIAYCIAKAGVIHLTRCLAAALAPHVLVNAVAPGLMEGTGMTVQLAQHFIDETKKLALLGKSSPPEDVAKAIVSLAQNDTITGQTLPVDAGVVFP
ncbi:MAG: SDR family oxidoreductase [Chloroflexi bacterium]|nr:SDR family oxidoreductase [Chloroflexota bacterium]